MNTSGGCDARRALINAAAVKLAQLVAQRGNASRRQLGFAGQSGEIVTRMRLESNGATGNAPVPGLIFQQCQHRLMAPVHAVEIANGQGAPWRKLTMLVAAENFHETDYRFYSVTARLAGPDWGNSI